MDISIVHINRSANHLPGGQIVFPKNVISNDVLSTQWSLFKPSTPDKQSFLEAKAEYKEWLKTTVKEERYCKTKPVSQELQKLYDKGVALNKRGFTLYLACNCKDELKPKREDIPCHYEMVRDFLNLKYKKENLTYVY